MSDWEETPDYISWLAWKHLGSPWRSWRRWLRGGRSGNLCLNCCPRKLDPDQQQKMDGWIDGLNVDIAN